MREANAESDELFEMANLFPRTTGLAMTVWVNTTHGNQMNIADTAVVGVRPRPRLIAGQLSPVDAQAVFRWVALNSDVLVAYWEGQIDTARMIHALKPLPPDHQPGQPPTP